MRRERGQASTEYLLIAVSVLMAVAAVGAASGGRSLDEEVETALRATVDEVTFLINLPF